MRNAYLLKIARSQLTSSTKPAITESASRGYLGTAFQPPAASHKQRPKHIHSITAYPGPGHHLNVSLNVTLSLEITCGTNREEASV